MGKLNIKKRYSTEGLSDTNRVVQLNVSYKTHVRFEVRKVTVFWLVTLNKFGRYEVSGEFAASVFTVRYRHQVPLKSWHLTSINHDWLRLIKACKFAHKNSRTH
jgi:hypothetical protein